MGHLLSSWHLLPEAEEPDSRSSYFPDCSAWLLLLLTTLSDTDGAEIVYNLLEHLSVDSFRQARRQSRLFCGEGAAELLYLHCPG